MHQQQVIRENSGPARIKWLAYGATGCCVVALALFLVGFLLDSWSVSRHNRLARLGMFQLCFPVESASGFFPLCAPVGWDCTAQQCSADAAATMCQTWYTFSPGGTGSVSAAGAGIGSSNIVFPGHGECGAYNAARIFLVMAFVGSGVAALILVESMSEPCGTKRHASHRESSPLLICIAGVITCCVYLLSLISILVFLLDVFNSATSAVGSSFLLAALSTVFMLLTLVLIMTAAIISANEEAARSPAHTLRQDFKTYRVGGTTVTVPDNHKVMYLEDVLSENPPTSNKNKARLTPSMSPMGSSDLPMSMVCGLELVSAGGKTQGGCSRWQEAAPSSHLGASAFGNEHISRFGSLPVSKSITSQPIAL